MTTRELAQAMNSMAAERNAPLPPAAPCGGAWGECGAPLPPIGATWRSLYPPAAQAGIPVEKQMILASDPTMRKGMPICRGVLDYFPLAIAEVAVVSKAGNDQHNPGQELHWARGKSTDHADCIARHLIDRGSRDTDGMRHSAKLAWRALAALQTELEAEAAADSSPRSAP